jgi:MoaA/NifB/PqqE/SkfB family radical SAM enzyme
LYNEKALLTPAERDLLIALHKKANRSSEYPKVTVLPYIESARLFGCTAGFNHIYIDASGNVCPCDFTPLSFGNIRHDDLEHILARLYEYFGKPRTECFMQMNYKKIQEQFEGEFPLPFHKARLICSATSAQDEQVPLLYKKLGV